MRIGIDARIVHYSRGGIRSYVVHLIEALAELDAETDYHILHSRKDRSLSLTSARASTDAVHPHPRPELGSKAQSSSSVETLGSNFHTNACWTPSHHRLERWALGIEVKRLGLDLLHSPDFIPPAFGYRRSVITIHDLNFLYYPRFLTAESRRYYNQQIEWAVERADHILADSHATKVDLTTLLDVPPERVTVVHLAADAAFHPLPEAETRWIAAQYGLKPGFLLFVGTLEPRKNVPGLLRAYWLLLDKGVTTAPLVLVGGKGWLYDEIFERVEVLGLTERVRFLYDVPDADLPGLYNAAGVLATPSFYEGFGLPALEAMACGTPVVVAERASLPEVVGEAGLLVNPDDPEDIARALESVLAEGALYTQMRERGLEQAARFTWEKTAQATLAVYHKVLAQ